MNTSECLMCWVNAEHDMSFKYANILCVRMKSDSICNPSMCQMVSKCCLFPLFDCYKMHNGILQWLNCWICVHFFLFSSCCAVGSMHSMLAEPLSLPLPKRSISLVRDQNEKRTIFLAVREPSIKRQRKCLWHRIES